MSNMLWFWVNTYFFVCMSITTSIHTHVKYTQTTFTHTTYKQHTHVSGHTITPTPTSTPTTPTHNHPHIYVHNHTYNITCPHSIPVCSNQLTHTNVYAHRTHTLYYLDILSSRIPPVSMPDTAPTPASIGTGNISPHSAASRMCTRSPTLALRSECTPPLNTRPSMACWVSWPMSMP
eukprot:NODE_250_length_2099_cov_158.212683_g168_i0.p1 GENE.NODE_250_length_2099_cov_158.212683_g168_i0~~NODE_250_length_2099_cov_158.212683_g168_i0.p1  ORF type:complete len:177 (-),score=15.74 NODE_250_length_2099_cov_158.212683_g168_i0:1210-1740(-)